MLPKGFVVRSTASLAIFFCRTAYIATRIRPTIRTKPAIAIPIIAPLLIEDLLLLGPEVDKWQFQDASDKRQYKPVQWTIYIPGKYGLARKLYGPNPVGALKVWLVRTVLILITSERLKLVSLTGKIFIVNVRASPGLNCTSERATDPGARLRFSASVNSRIRNNVGLVTSEKAGARKNITPWKGLVHAQFCEVTGLADWSVGHGMAAHGPRLVAYGSCRFCLSVHKLMLEQ